jgi:hypothetical protein
MRAGGAIVVMDRRSRTNAGEAPSHTHSATFTTAFEGEKILTMARRLPEGRHAWTVVRLQGIDSDKATGEAALDLDEAPLIH